MRASRATSWRRLSSGRAGAMGLLTFLLSGRELGALDVDRDSSDAAVVGEVEHERLRRVGPVDTLGELRHRDVTGVDHAVDLHGIAAERRQELADEGDVGALASVDVTE